MAEFNKMVETENTLNKIRLLTPPAGGRRPAPMPSAGAVVTGESRAARRRLPRPRGSTSSRRATRSGRSRRRTTARRALYPKIFEANRDVLDDPDRIKPGQKLRIPD